MEYDKTNHRKVGFSLVELSIVLVLIGLLIAAVIIGKEMIRSAELKSVAKEFSAFKATVSTFRLKYNAIPGDMKNAENFWGTAHATDATCKTTNATGTATCNGDGDGVVDPAADSLRSNEYFRFWQHLSNAQLLPEEYTGVAGSGSVYDAVRGVNVAESAFVSAGWSAASLFNYAGNANVYALDYGNMLQFGNEYEPAGGMDGIALTPMEAYDIDRKIDDSRPAQGMVIAMHWNNLCAAADDGSHANNDYNASYRTTDETIRCALYFRRLW